MRMMIKVQIPVDAGNKAIQEGALPKIVAYFMETHKPESAYFFPENGMRTMCAVFDLKQTSQIPQIAEPFFDVLHAMVTFQPVMNYQELGIGLQAMMKK